MLTALTTLLPASRLAAAAAVHGSDLVSDAHVLYRTDEADGAFEIRLRG